MTAINKNTTKKTIQAYNETAKHYESLHNDIQEIETMIKDFIRIIPGKKILDVGCAHGRDAKYFTENGFQVTGIDLSKNLLALARKNAPQAKFLQMDMRNLHFIDNAFDGIWACASFLHLPKKDALKTLQEFRRVLQNQGVLYLGVKKGLGEQWIERKENQGQQKFFAFYSKKEIGCLVKQAGFQIIKIICESDKRGNFWINVFARKV